MLFCCSWILRRREFNDRAREATSSLPLSSRRKEKSSFSVISVMPLSREEILERAVFSRRARTTNPKSRQAPRERAAVKITACRTCL